VIIELSGKLRPRRSDRVERKQGRAK